MALKKWMLPNGLWVLAEEMPHTDLVGITLHIKGGARLDSDNCRGIAHFLEHVFFRGTEKYPDREILNSLIEADGGSWNAMTSHEKICCYTSVFPHSAEKSFDAISQMIFHPLFRDNDIDLERGAVLEEMNISTDDPEDCAHDLYRRAAWGSHPIARDILGTREHIENASRGHFNDYHGQYFYPGNMVLSVAGGISANEVFDLAMKYFYEGERKSRVVFSGDLVPAPGRMSVMEKDAAQVNVIMGTRAFDWLSTVKDRTSTASAMLLFKILGGSTRLFKKVREEMGLVYKVYSSGAIYTDCGSAYTYFGSEPGKALTALKITMEEYDNVLKNGVTDEELKRAKLSIKRQYSERKEKSLNVALSNGGSELLTEETLEGGAEYSKYIEPLTQDDLRAVAPELLRRENQYLVLVGKVGDKRQEYENLFLS